MEPPVERPIVHCLVALPAGDGRVRRILRVSLEEAEQRKADGWYVVGPDPQDMIDLAQWEKAQRG